ncbi:pentatricopeptide repeat-containing protein [Hordeum vulgare]|nr:pentatricopeptide repeat-containing protein [Hordeum vulgare]
MASHAQHACAIAAARRGDHGRPRGTCRGSVVGAELAADVEGTRPSASDLSSLLKVPELSGHWEWALAASEVIDAVALKMLGREGRHGTVCDLLDEMLLPL